MKKKLAIALAALWVTPALAAKGVITEVNPSGVGTGVILQGAEGEEGRNSGEPGIENRNANAGNNGVAGFNDPQHDTGVGGTTSD